MYIISAFSFLSNFLGTFYGTVVAVANLSPYYLLEQQEARAQHLPASSMTLCLHCCKVCGDRSDLQMLAWLKVATISSYDWPMSRRSEAIAVRSSAHVMVFVELYPLGSTE